MPAQKVPARRTVEAWDSELSRLYERHESITAEIARIAEERRPLALAAVSDDLEALASLQKLNARQVDLMMEADTVQMAVSQVGEHRRAEAARAEVEAQAARLAEAREATAGLIEASREVDRAFAAAAAALVRRGELATRLAGLGFRANRLWHVEPVARAAGAAGLRGRLPIQFGPLAMFQPLADADTGTLSAVLSPAEKRAAA